MKAVAFAVTVALATLGPERALHAEPATRALEVDVFGGLLRRGGLTVSDELSTRNGGPALAMSAQYRSRYFLAPFLDVGYYSLAASDRVVDLGGGATHVVNGSWAFGFSGGAALDIWRVRLRAGLGAYDLVVRTVTPAARSTVSELDFGYVASATAYPLVRGRVRIGIEARVGLIVEAQTGFISLGATLGGDAISF
jgi:hypothetical protein